VASLINEENCVVSGERKKRRRKREEKEKWQKQFQQSN